MLDNLSQGEKNHRLGTSCSPIHNWKVHLKKLTEILQSEGCESNKELQAVPRKNVSMSELLKINSSIETILVCKSYDIHQRNKNF